MHTYTYIYPTWWRVKRT